MSGSVDRLVFVVGCPRSGTTWLQSLLLSHPAAVGPGGESFLFVTLRPWTRRWDEPDGGWLPDRGERRAVTRRLCDRLLDAFVVSTGRSSATVVEKTPAHVHDLDVIAELYPDAYVVHVVRDGRDVARSLVEFDFGTPDVATGARAWAAALASAERSSSRLAHYREVRYEDVVTDPVREVTTLLEWVGLDVDDGVREALASTANVRVSQYNTRGPVGPGKWASLDAAELAAVYVTAGPLLVLHGYLSATDWRRERRRPRVLLARMRQKRGRTRSGGWPSR